MKLRNNYRAIRKSGRRIVVIDEFIAWNNFKAAIDSGYFDLNNPKLQSRDAEWLKFLSGFRTEYPSVDTDLATTIRSLTEISVFRLPAEETIVEELSFSP
jgi:hypothetical protein